MDAVYKYNIYYIIMHIIQKKKIKTNVLNTTINSINYQSQIIYKFELFIEIIDIGCNLV